MKPESTRSFLARLANRVLAPSGYEVVRTRSLAAHASEAPKKEAIPGQDAAAITNRVAGNHRELLRHQIGMKWRLVDTILREGARQGPPEIRQACPLCGHQGPVDGFKEYVSHCIFGGGTLLRHQCPSCDLIFGPRKMLELAQADLTDDYEWHYRAFEEGDSTAMELRAFHALRPRRDGVYLNWGAGSWSRTIGLLRQDGWNVSGYEPHHAAAASGEHMLGADTLDAMRFNGIFSNNVLEHLRHPVTELARMRSLLLDDGRMSHATPCFEYRYEYTRFHLFFFLGRSRAELAGRAGLAIDEFVADGDFMNVVLSKA